MSNIIPLGTVQSDWAEFTITVGPRKFFDIGNASKAEYEFAQKGSDGVYYHLKSMGVWDLKDEGVIGSPGTYAVRRVYADSPSGLDMEGSL